MEERFDNLVWRKSLDRRHALGALGLILGGCGGMSTRRSGDDSGPDAEPDSGYDADSHDAGYDSDTNMMTPGRPIADFANRVRSLWYPEGIDTVEWVAELEPSHLQYVQDFFSEWPVTLNPIVSAPSGDSNYVLLTDRQITEPLPGPNTGMLHTVYDGDIEAIILSGTNYEARRIASELWIGAMMYYFPPTDDDGERYDRCNLITATFDGEYYHPDFFRR
ncbi:hypothetical protein KY362_04245 [Candidatus Woesearchaeota archaeon]|nr:hypothetical protein [Candidatus Woesearchaeota archaeon]